MLNVHDLSVSFQGEYLFENVAFMLNAGDRVGLIGKNGAGKSTMLKLLAKELKPDSGTIATDKEINIGFLKQDIDFENGRTILEEAYQAFQEIKHLEEKIDQIHNEMELRTDYESESYHNLMDTLSEITHRYEIIGGYQYKGNTEKVLLGLGFQRSDFQKQTDTFSGGWRMRIELAKLLLQNNDILLLDEPTNHLDIESIIWLEQFLTTYAGAVVIVSHDKMFLDNVTNRTIEISVGKIYDYPKPYSKFLELRQEIREQQLASQKNQEKKIQQTEKLIEKFRAKATKASMAQSLMKKLDKIERIEVDEEDNAVMNVRFPVSVTPGKVVLEIQNASKNYGEKEVLQNIDLLIERGSKIAFVGQNGQGKTTLAKMIVDEIPFEGSIRLGHNVQLGYFAQNQAAYLDGEVSVVDTMFHAANDSNRMNIRDILGSFLFRGDDVEKKVKVLSGGERNRLALAKMLLSDFNVLVMDEPTNHLDIKSKNVLKKALQNFEGTLIIVSHDRDFLQGLTDKVYEFKNKNIKEYLGDIDFYLEQRAVENFREIEQNKEVVSEAKNVEKKEKLSFEQQKQQKTIQNKINKIENLITDIEKEIEQMNFQMGQEVQSDDFYKKYDLKKKELEKLMQEWEELMG
ncbi:ABC-F family ATP-binding cassette domain-containing protein [Capnocytophaga cynodegmi]|uniref:Probable ATP-binding protein YbiT n=1 Tax=Capnocytophaga cynodegmi TaxID=28189 RepID=A0A0B7HTT1_9FLAO|nr:ABC-F family ATP-binding cassette domain-containing protein [Capnocytophaga cynodegmi]CEN33751.1 ABC transporter, ATP-binding protein [Capnocytophaga cynodegmi]CEN42014.1 ABC transporter, ATP-binding protein [Capnocytophaga cynodegmi]